jgi:hypothetical protein
VIQEPISSSNPVWQTRQLINNSGQATQMPKSTDPSRFDTEQPGFPLAHDDPPEPVRQRDVQCEPNHEHHSGSMRRPAEGPPHQELLRWLIRSVAVIAVVGSFALLCVGATPFLTVLPAAIRAWALLRNGPISSLPLLFAGFAYIVLQAVLRPRPLELLKRLMLGAAFLLWGVVQLMPTSDLATELGNLVIALYVFDLGLMIWTDLRKIQPQLIR